MGKAIVTVVVSVAVVLGAATVLMLARGGGVFGQGMTGGGMMGGGMMGRGMMGNGMMGSGGSIARHRYVMTSGVPAPYDAMRVPAPRTPATLDRGAAVYAENCESCHGPRGEGDGPAGKDLSPPPGNLAAIAQMPMMASDGYLYWTIAEGGEKFGSAMPAFHDALSKDEIQAVVAYVQAGLPPRRDDQSTDRSAAH